MTFAADLKRFTVTVETRSRDVVFNMTQAVKDSIVEGDTATGAPGQPVDTGFLKASWQSEVAPDGRTGFVGTNVAYAPVIETGLRSAYDSRGVVGRYGVTGGRIGPALPSGASRRPIKSTVGGKGSVRLTVANADRLLARVVRELGGGA